MGRVSIHRRDAEAAEENAEKATHRDYPAILEISSTTKSGSSIAM